jgi:hypothetical protein
MMMYNSVMSDTASTPAAKNLAKVDISKLHAELTKRMVRINDDSGAEYNGYNGDPNALKKNVYNLRDSLDTDLESLAKGKDSIYNEYQSHYESTLMSGMLWGTLTATVIYYVFYS